MGLLLTWCLFAADDLWPPAKPFTVKVLCLGEDSQPLSGVALKVVPWGRGHGDELDGDTPALEEIARGRSAGDGRDALDLEFPAGVRTLELRAAAPGHAPQWALFDRKTNKELRLHLFKAVGTLRGTLNDADGDPVAGAVVCYWRFTGPATYTKTDRQGRYQFEGVAPADAERRRIGPDGKLERRAVDAEKWSWEVVARHPDYGTTWAKTGDLTKPADMRFLKPTIVEGVVTDEKNEPRAGVGVQLIGAEHRAGGNGRSSPKGEYRVAMQAKQDDKYNVACIDHADYTCLAIDGVPAKAGGIAKAPPLKTLPGSWIEGVVLEDAANAPLDAEEHDNEMVCITGPACGVHSHRLPNTLVGKDGKFRFRAPPGSNEVFLLPGPLDIGRRVVVVPDDGSPVAVTLRRRR